MSPPVDLLRPQPTVKQRSALCLFWRRWRKDVPRCSSSSSTHMLRNWWPKTWRRHRGRHAYVCAVHAEWMVAEQRITPARVLPYVGPQIPS